MNTSSTETVRDNNWARRRAERRRAESLERELAEMSDVELVRLARDTGDGDRAVAAAERLLAMARPLIRSRSQRHCIQLAHLGRRNCTGITCDRAWLSCHHVVTTRVIGLPPLTAVVDTRDARHLPGVPPDVARGPANRHSALGSMPTTDTEHGGWLRAVNSQLGHAGLATDCLRQWNTDRGLTVRIDQHSYVTDSRKTPTPFYIRLVEEWERLRTVWKGVTPPPLTADSTVSLLRAVYLDACQWGYVESKVTRSRLKAGHLRPDGFDGTWRSWLTDALDRDDSDDLLGTCMTSFVECVERACWTDEDGHTLQKALHPVADSIATAYSHTRHEPVGVGYGTIEDLPDLDEGDGTYSG